MKEPAHHHARFFSLSLDMLCIAGFDGYFKELSPSWEKVLGFTLEELLAKPYLDFIHPDDRHRTSDQAEHQAQGNDAVLFRNRYRCKDGSYKWLLWQATQDPKEQLIYAIARDITEQKRMEDALRQSHEELESIVRERTAELAKANDELRSEIQERQRIEQEKEKLQVQFIQAQKMEAVGRLAGGIAHDFNNLLTAIMGYSAFLLQKLPKGDPSREDVEEISKAGDRAAGLTRQLLAFSRQQVLQPRPLNVNAVVTGIESMLRRILGEDVEMTLHLGSDLGTIMADPGQLEQVLTNLVINSRDAMPKGGRILIETANVELDASYAKSHLEAKPGPHVMLAVTDEGCGMDEKVLAHIFEPFFTTKEQGKGTGLGLATTFGIVKQSGGSIFVYSEPGHGTTFKVYLPVVQVAPEPLKAGGARAPETGVETVLLVEDEELVRKFAARALRMLGYTVVDARDGEEALALCAKSDKPIDLLLSDIVMPKMHGTELAERVRALVPGVKVLFMSGYTDQGVVHGGLLGSGTPFIQKPITPDTLARKVRQVLDAAA
ncbi:MAG: response regulator [Elusimicrobia bacterium]|nr:response regulator [Elusimicrobiota bacterium]